MIDDKVEGQPLPPVKKPGDLDIQWRPPWSHQGETEATAAHAREDLDAEIARALKGSTVAEVRRHSPDGDPGGVGVAADPQRPGGARGPDSGESGDVDEIVAAQRLALLPFILIAITVTLASSLLLIHRIAQPGDPAAARAADRVTASRARAISLPDIAQRDDELGDLTRSLETMTRSLSERMDAIERFAADVAHEIRNPLTSIRSAVETLDLVSRTRRRVNGLTDILKHDVGRLDRADPPDISNASRAGRRAVARGNLGPSTWTGLLADICGALRAIGPADPARSERAVQLRDRRSAAGGGARARGRPLSQVFRNLIDNAKSFSPACRRQGRRGAGEPAARRPADRCGGRG